MLGPYQVVTGGLERIGPTHIEGGGAEWLQHPDVVEAFCLQGKHTHNQQAVTREPACPHGEGQSPTALSPSLPRLICLCP